MPRHSGPRATPATPDEGGRVACGHRSDGSTRTSLLKVAETHDAPAQTIENIAERLAGDDSPADLHGLRHLSHVRTESIESGRFTCARRARRPCA